MRIAWPHAERGPGLARAFSLAVALLTLLGLSPAAGAAGPFDGVFVADDGLTGEWRAWLPDDVSPDPGAGLLVYFHVDGRVGQQRADADGLRDLGLGLGMAVAALSIPGEGAPPTDLADQCWWAPRPQRNAAYLAEWIDDVLVGDLGVSLDPDRVIFAGHSGGGDFAAAALLHLGFAYRGGAVAVCGGDLPRADGGSCSDSDPPPVLDPLPGAGDLPAGAVDSTAFRFAVSPDDPYFDTIQSGFEFWEDLGFDADFEVAPGGGHCEFDDGGYNLLLTRGIEAIAADLPGGCVSVDVSAPAAALVDSVPLDVAAQAIPLDAPDRDALLAKIAKKLDAVAELRASIPDRVDVCSGDSACPKLGVRSIVRKIEKRLVKLKKGPVKQALAQQPDRDEKRRLKDLNKAAHQAKLEALESLPPGARLCGG